MALSTYVALLRGINVGGNNIIPMKALAATFEKMKLANVKTYIASGNVIFQCEACDTRKLEKRIEAALKKAHAYDATVVLKTRAELLAIAKGIPAAWKKPTDDVRYYVCFLRHEVDDRSVLEQLTPKKDVDHLSYKAGALYWSANKDALTRSGMAKLPSHPLYKKITIRNLNTTLKLAELTQPLS